VLVDRRAGTGEFVGALNGGRFGQGALKVSVTEQY
jgi:hypothetical protein